MASIYLWNSIANRRRSISDTFYENGLATLKSFVEAKGHQVKIIDFANNQYYSKVSPAFLVWVLRKIYKKLFQSKNMLLKAVLHTLSLFLQKGVTIYQRWYFRKSINSMIVEMKNQQIRILGIKVWYGDAFLNADYLAAEVKKKIPGMIVIAGGYHVTLYEEQLIKESHFDIGVPGPGGPTLSTILNIIDQYANSWNRESVLSDIISRAQNGEMGPLFYWQNGAVNSTSATISAPLDPIIPVYDFSPDKVKIHVLVESSGCPWGKCNFCVHNYFNKENQQRDLNNLMAEIRIMKSNGIGLFRFAGSDTPPFFGAKIAQKILDEDIKIIYSMGSRAVKFAKDHYKELVTSYEVLLKSGLRAIFMGGECGNDRINKEIMNKGICAEDLEYTIKAFREAELNTGIKAYMLLALIYPPPLPHDISIMEVEKDNLNLLERTMPDSVMISPPAPFIHSRWFEERDKFGFETGPDFINKIMKYEYVLYKPPKMWPPLNISLNGKPYVTILDECSAFRNKVQHTLGIPTDVADEHILMFMAAGMSEKNQIIEARMETMLDIIACDYSYTQKLSEKVNQFSEEIARQ
jgi:hypothetical protein